MKEWCTFDEKAFVEYPEWLLARMDAQQCCGVLLSAKQGVKMQGDDIVRMNAIVNALLVQSRNKQLPWARSSSFDYYYRVEWSDMSVTIAESSWGYWLSIQDSSGRSVADKTWLTGDNEGAELFHLARRFAEQTDGILNDLLRRLNK